MEALTKRQCQNLMGTFYFDHQQFGKNYIVKRFKDMGMKRSANYRVIAEVERTGITNRTVVVATIRK